MGQVLSKRAKSYVLLLCCVGQFMVILDVSVVNVALPAIRSDLGFSSADLQWVVNSYTLLFAGFLLLGGRAADLLSRRDVFVWGFVLFAGSSLVGGVAPDGVTLVVARAVQGLGAAVLAPATLSILTSTFTAPDERNRAIGAWGATGGGGGAIGTLLGGLLTELLDWRWVLFINVPIGVLAVLGALRYVPAGRPGQRPRRSFDLAGAVTASAGLIAVVYGIVETDSHGWSSPHTLVALAVGVVLLALFAVVERNAACPLLPLRVFRRRRLATANAVVLLLGFAMVPMWYFVTLYLQQVLGYSPIEAGLAFVPMASTLAIFSRTAGPLALRFGADRVLTAGMVLIAAGMLLFALMPVHGTFVLHVLPPMLVTAVGMGVGFVAVTAAATDDAPKDEVGLASGLVNTSRQVGGSLGLAVLATVANGRTESLLGHASAAAATTGGFHWAFAVAALGAAVGALLSTTLTRPTPAADTRPAYARSRT